MLTIYQKKEIKRYGRHRRIRRKIVGTAARPRLCVHRSLKNLYVQIIDDVNGKVLLGLSTLNKSVRQKEADGGNVKGAARLGEAVAGLAKKQGITSVAFDRGGYLFHGRVKAFAESARKAGLHF